MSGLVFLLFAMWLNIDVFNIEYKKVATLVFGIFFFSVIFIVVGIFKENKKIQRSVFNFGIIVEIIYMVYLYILNTSIYRYIIYLPIILFITLMNNSKKINERNKLIAFFIFILIGIYEICLL